MKTCLQDVMTPKLEALLVHGPSNDQFWFVCQCEQFDELKLGQREGIVKAIAQKLTEKDLCLILNPSKVVSESNSRSISSQVDEMYVWCPNSIIYKILSVCHVPKPPEPPVYEQTHRLCQQIILTSFRTCTSIPQSQFPAYPLTNRHMAQWYTW